MRRRIPCIASVLGRCKRCNSARGDQTGRHFVDAALLGSAFNEAEYRRVFRSMEQDRVDALMVSDEPENSAYRPTIVELAAKGRIPAIIRAANTSKLAG